MAILAPGAISYVLPINSANFESGEHPTWFQGFSPRNLLSAQVLLGIAKLPSHVEELRLTRNDLIVWRASGASPYQIFFLETDLLALRLPELAFVCVISGVDTLDLTNDVIQKTGVPALHATIAPQPGPVLPFAKLDRETLAEWLWSHPKFPAGDAPTVIATEQAGVRRLRHNLTVPNECTLEALGLGLIPSDPLPAVKPYAEGDDLNAQFVQAITESAIPINKIRDDHVAGRRILLGMPSLILSTPSVFRWIRPPSTRELPDTPETRAARLVLGQLTRQTTYSQFQTTSKDMPLLQSAIARELVNLRRLELECYTAVLAIRGSGMLAPVLRIPPIGSRIRDGMNRLAGAARAEGSNRRAKMNRLAKDIGVQLRSHVPEKLLPLIDRPQTGVKLIADVPFELLPVDGLPLSLARTVSRLPTLTGDQLLRRGLANGSLIVSAEELSRVTVLRCFKEGDRLAPLTERAFRTVLRDASKPPQIRFIDVRDKADFIAALQPPISPILILDGHGFQAPTDSFGVLEIGRDRIHLMELRADVHFPAIVILSACETHPLDGTHQSVANAALAMGAIAVLGTLTPIEGRHAAVLLARLMLRLSDFLPAISAPILWNEVVSGLLRMSYVTDSLDALGALGQIRLSPEERRTVQLEANLAINSFRADWFERTVESVAQIKSLPSHQVGSRWREVAFFTETLQYVQLGDPERILIAPADAIASARLRSRLREKSEIRQ